MSELDAIKLNPDNQLLLEGPSLRLPYEVSRRNLKTAQKHIERDRDHVLAQLKQLTATVASVTNSNDPDNASSKQQVLTHLDNLLARLKGLKEKLEELEQERQALNRQSTARIAHLAELWQIYTVSDVKYETWSKTRLDRLTVDYMLRKGYIESAQRLADQRGIRDLVDVDLFTAAHRVATALRNGSLTEALAWCAEHKPLLKNLKTTSSNGNLRSSMSQSTSAAAHAPANGNTSRSAASAERTGPADAIVTTTPSPSATSLDFQLRLQQCIGLLCPSSQSGNTRNIAAARAHASKYLSPHFADPLHETDVRAISALLVFPPDASPLRYASYYSPARWEMLAELFTATFLELWGLPRDAGLKRALKAGLTALKTPSCHSVYQSPESVGQAGTSNSDRMDVKITGAEPSSESIVAGATTSGTKSGGGPDSSPESTTKPVVGTVPGARLCPICSTELNELARDLPYAHHSQSLVDPDPVVLPNARIYGRARLREFAIKMGVPEGHVRDPVTGEEYADTDLHKVFIM